jgi:alpha-beta hydrolase superfamily lysophospholipase
VPPYEQIVDDICDEIHRQAVDAEQIMLMGYSFGGALMILAAHQLEQDPKFNAKIVGFIGVSTAFDVGHNVPRWQLGLVNAIGPVSRFLFEKAWRLSRLLTIQEMDADLISPDITVTQSLKNDPLVYKGRIPLATSAQVYQAGIKAKLIMQKFSLPSLLVHSRDDRIALAPDKSTFGEHVQLRLFSKLRHNCIDGISREVVVSRKIITQFIVTKL